MLLFPLTSSLLKERPKPPTGPSLSSHINHSMDIKVKKVTRENMFEKKEEKRQ